MDADAESCQVEYEDSDLGRTQSAALLEIPGGQPDESDRQGQRQAVNLGLDRVTPVSAGEGHKEAAGDAANVSDITIDRQIALGAEEVADQSNSQQIAEHGRSRR